MYKDKERERIAARERKRRERAKGVTLGVTTGEGVTYPDIIDKLTNPFWRPRIEKICSAFQHSHHPAYSQAVWLGDTNLSTACDWLWCTG